MQKDSMGYPLQVELWNPDTVQGGMENGRPTYKVDGKMVDRKSVAHFRTYRMPGTPWGLSPIRYAALAINREAAIQQFAYGYFNDAPHPQAVLTSDQSISDTEAETVKKRLLAKMRGREPLVLGAGIKYQPLSVSPEESQFLATQKLGVAEIARIYSVPPEMIAAEAGNSMTYANVEQRGISFLTYSIQPFLAKLEDFLSSMLPGKNHVRFDPSVLLRTDYHTLVQANSVAIASKQITPDEARAKMDLPPLTQAQKDILELVPLTVSPSGRPIVQPIGSGAPIADLTPSTPPQGAPA
jgi:HK97 family phage portal protein